MGGEMRFCSRCGFPLTIVSQLVANGGALAGFDTEGKRQLTPRESGVRWGALLMIISAVLFPIVLLFAAMKHDAIVLLLPVFLVFLVGMARLLYAKLLQPNTPIQKEVLFAAGQRMDQQLSSEHRLGLPANQNVPVSAWRQPIDTSEMAQPPSVTDNTTKLLSDDAELKS
jgi:choline-glycine betaine transporter